MSLQVIGAGLPRTGTLSLKVALERLLGGTCYHMSEVFEHIEHAPVWRDALHGKSPDWTSFLAGYTAGVDWPIAMFWRELADAYPDALVILSHRESPATWHRSMERTVFEKRRQALRNGRWTTPPTPDQLPPWAEGAAVEDLRAMGQMFEALNGTTFPDLDDRAAVLAVYERHLAEVRSTIPPERLLEWQPGDGWKPLCAALDMPIPEIEFPHQNSAARFNARGRRPIMPETE